MRWMQPDRIKQKPGQMLHQILNTIFSHYTQQDIKIIFRSGFIRLAVPAFEAFMNDDPLTLAQLHRDRFHQSAAVCSPIPGADINMLRVEAVGAVIGITVSFDFPAAVFTDKVFCFANK